MRGATSGKSALCGAALLLLACGGQAERTIEEGGGSGGGSKVPSGGRPNDDPNGGTPLQPCEPGFTRFDGSGRSCNWLAEGLCYEAKEAACACVCPRDRDSLCLSGFGTEGSATPVICD